MRKATGVLLALCASIMWLTPTFAADWPNFRGGAGATGASTETLALPLTEVWHSAAPSVEENGGVVSNGIVYMSSDANKLYAFHVATGLDVAGFPVDIGFSYGSPAVDAANGKVYSLSSTGLQAFNLNGSAAWTGPGASGTNYNQGPVVDAGYVYVNANGTLYKYDSAGTLQWSVTAGGGSSQPAIMGGYVYSNTGSGSIRKFDKATGAEVTTGGFPISTGTQTASLAAVNNRLFFKANVLYAYSADNGSLLWSQAAGGNGSYNDSPAVSGGAVYVYGADGIVYAFDEVTGTPSTGFPSVNLGSSVANYSSPTVAGDYVFVGAGRTQKLVVLGAAGSAQAGQVVEEHQLFSVDTQGFDLCSPVISDGYVFAMLDGGGLYAFYAGGGTVPTGALSINNGATCTASPDVTLTLDNNGDTSIVSMRISEDSQFTGVAWESYSPTRSFTLSTGYGTKTVYAQFMNSSEQLSNVFTATIDYTSACSALQVLAPSGQTVNPGTEVLYSFTVGYTGTGTPRYDLTAVSEHGWTVETRNTGGSPITYVDFDGDGTETVIVAVAVPSGAAGGTRDLVTLTATDDTGEGETGSASTTTVVASTNGETAVMCSPAAIGAIA